MNRDGNTWALVLAAGEGTRLRSLTTLHSGASIPKQFCSLRGGASLCQEALKRGQAISSPTQLCMIVAAQHRHWWRAEFDGLPTDNLIVQPKNLGTAIGILLPLLRIIERDPQARIVLLPADHHVEDEAALTEATRHAIASATVRANEVVLLGIEPEEPDIELGYIVPGNRAGQWSLNIDKFVEKPDRQTALRLLDAGALWNSFIIVANAQTLLQLYLQRYSEVVAEMHAVVVSQRSAAQSAVHLVDLYERLPELDFSRHILEGQESHLSVVPVPHCGWTDLGTPKRVGEVLRKGARHHEDAMTSIHLNLAVQHERLKVREPAVA